MNKYLKALRDNTNKPTFLLVLIFPDLIKPPSQQVVLRIWLTLLVHPLQRHIPLSEKNNIYIQLIFSEGNQDC